MACQHSLLSVIDASSHTLPTRTFSPAAPLLLPASLADSLSARSLPIFYLPATPSQFAMFLPADRAPTHIASSRRIARLRPHRLFVHAASPSRYGVGSSVSSHGSARGGEGEPDMPVRRGSARLLMAFVRYDRCRIVYPFPQVIGAADTRY